MAERKDDCIFCKMVAGEVPSSKVYEDDYCLAFMDIGPLAPGHLLVIPKGHYERLWEMDTDTAKGIAEQLGPLSKAVTEASGAEGCNLLQNNGQASGQVVMHVHFHIIPRKTGDGLGYRWNAGQYAEGEMEAMRQAIADKIE